MSSNSLLAKVGQPYAEALLALGESSHQVETLDRDMKLVLETLADTPELEAFLGRPLVATEAKKAVIRQVFGTRVGSTSLNFLLLLVDRGRIALLPSIGATFQDLVRQLTRTALAQVTTATALTSEQSAALESHILRLTGAQQVDLTVTVDPELLAGFTVQVGSQVIDTSLRSQLRRLAARLSQPTA
ncbi:MAG: F0F1 ATP synthase subunit delta [Gloeomargaritaceae cyanobacterium C42_A2020_066]|nr:F0F1 ATP synthase subunit delta [Gloeomargaritaceae cyanobacterium C42_A2020_066]